MPAESSTRHLPPPHRFSNRKCQLFNRHRISWYRVALAMIEERSSVLVAHVKQAKCAVDIGVLASDNVACGNVDDNLALVG